MNTPKVAFVAAAVIIGGGIILQWQINARLRRETVQLRHANAEMKAALAEKERLAGAASPTEAPAPPRQARGPDASPGTGEARPAEAIPPSAAPAHAIVDRSTPQSVAETVRVAIEGGDPDTLVNLITIAPDGLDLAQHTFEKLPDELRARYGTPERMVAELLCATTPPPPADQTLVANEMPGTGGLDPDIAEGTEYRTLHTITQDPSGATIERREIYHNSQGGWRWVISSREVLRRLTETGLGPSPAPTTATPPGGNQ